jgi:hypothetical protein
VTRASAQAQQGDSDQQTATESEPKPKMLFYGGGSHVREIGAADFKRIDSESELHKTVWNAENGYAVSTEGMSDKVLEALTAEGEFAIHEDAPAYVQEKLAIANRQLPPPISQVGA